MKQMIFIFDLCCKVEKKICVQQKRKEEKRFNDLQPIPKGEKEKINFFFSKSQAARKRDLHFPS